MSWELGLVETVTGITSQLFFTDILKVYTALGSYLMIPFYFFLLQNFSEKETANKTVITVIVTGGIVLLLKNLFKRPRPLAMLITEYGYSFPSGHAALSFTLAAVFSNRWEGKKTFFYTMASIIALTRVFLGVHYPSDIIAGSLLGFGIAKLVLKTFPKIEKKK